MFCGSADTLWETGGSVTTGSKTFLVISLELPFLFTPSLISCDLSCDLSGQSIKKAIFLKGKSLAYTNYLEKLQVVGTSNDTDDSEQVIFGVNMQEDQVLAPVLTMNA